MPSVPIKLPPLMRQKAPGGAYYYIYTGTPVWNKEKKRAEVKNKTSIGRLKGDKVLFSSRYLEEHPELVGVEVRRVGRQYQVVAAAQKQDALVDWSQVSTKNFGATYVFQILGQQTQLLEHLRATFPDSYREILAAAYLLLLYPTLSVANFDVEQAHTCLPTQQKLTSQFLSTLFTNISHEAQSIMEFFKLRAAWVSDQGPDQHSYLAFDSTSVSTCSTGNGLAAWGKNKDGDTLPQFNLALLSDQNTGVPIYFRLLNGSIPDVATLTQLFRDATQLDLDEFHLIMDRGYYSQANISEMLEIGVNFVIGSKTGLSMIQGVLAQAEEEFWRCSRQCLLESPHGDKLYAYTQKISWGYLNARKIPLTEEVYIHLYADNLKAEEQKQVFQQELTRVLHKAQEWELVRDDPHASLEKRLRSQLNPEEARMLEKYFTRTKAGKWMDNLSAQQTHFRQLGVLCLVSNDIANAADALEKYRQRNMIERNFQDLKQRLSAKRAMVHSEQALLGKTFVQFVALSLRMVMHHRLTQVHRRLTLKNNSVNRLIRSLNCVTLTRYCGKYRALSEISKTQRTYFQLLEVKEPTNEMLAEEN